MFWIEFFNEKTLCWHKLSYSPILLHSLETAKAFAEDDGDMYRVTTAHGKVIETFSTGASANR